MDPGIRDIVKNLIPVQLVGMKPNGEEVIIGNFHSGLVLNGMSLQDVTTNHIVASCSMRSRGWVVDGKHYRYLFCQVMPTE